MSVETARIQGTQHELTVSQRKSMQISGVTEVLSFDEQAVALNTDCGGMEVQGSALHIHVLDIGRGLVCLDGRIDSIAYFEQDPVKKDGKSGFFAKLFR